MCSTTHDGERWEKWRHLRCVHTTSRSQCPTNIGESRFLLLAASISAAASSLRRFTRRRSTGNGDWPSAGHVHTKHGGHRRLARLTVAARAIARARQSCSCECGCARVYAVFVELTTVCCRRSLHVLRPISVTFGVVFFSQQFFSPAIRTPDSPKAHRTLTRDTAVTPPSTTRTDPRHLCRTTTTVRHSFVRRRPVLTTEHHHLRENGTYNMPPRRTFAGDFRGPLMDAARRPQLFYRAKKRTPPLVLRNQ